MTPVASVAAEWDRRYAKPGYAYGTRPNDFLVSVAESIPTGRVLCLGEGEGRNAVHLARLGHDVTAVDVSRVGMQKTRQLAHVHGVTVTAVVADLADFSLGDEHWDGIISIFCHLPSPLRRHVHASVVSGLKPGGVFVLESYTPRQIELGTGGPPVPELLVTLAQLEQDIAGLELLVAREAERNVTEGRCHHGRSAVVQVVGTRPEATT
ncbi:MAG: class I SAM-dependent methyltransferase [Gemmatimonadales bacterium]|jgi:SAM-dependent methyltransferase